MMSGASDLRLAAWPKPGVNPYVALFHRALEPHGIGCSELVVNDHWLADHASRIDVLQLHWPEDLWRLRGAGAAARLRGVAGVWRYLRLARRLGIKRVWTVHNLEHHEGVDWIDRCGYQILAANCDLLICHSRWAAEQVRRRYHPRGDTIVMPIGSYRDVYPVPRDRRTVLNGLGLRSDLPAVAVVGYLRKYKGIDIACDAIARLDGRVQLIVAGRPHPDLDLASLRQRSSAQTVLVARELTEQELADIVGASDAVILPYTKVTTASVLVTAWACGRGVVASDLPYFREMLDQCAEAGACFKTGDPNDLATAIRTYLDVPAQQRMRASLAMAERYSWDRCIVPVATWMRQCQDVANRRECAA